MKNVKLKQWQREQIMDCMRQPYFRKFPRRYKEILISLMEHGVTEKGKCSDARMMYFYKVLERASRFVLNTNQLLK